jgi:hypothetical protein
MRKFTVLLAASILAVLIFGVHNGYSATAAKKKANKDTAAWRYEIEYAKTGGNNMLVVKVWSYAKKAAVAIEQGKKNAVHGVIFKGYTSTGGGTVSQRPLLSEPDAANQHRDFLDEFWADGGPYRTSVSAVADGSTETRKVGKEYKVGIVVTVNKDALRSDLEKAGIVRALGAGF